MAVGPAHALERFIPACAGNSAASACLLAAAAVHPRVCGEQTVTAQGMQIAAGSSPRVRGTAKMVSGFTTKRRFIPACAGNRALAG